MENPTLTENEKIFIFNKFQKNVNFNLTNFQRLPFGPMQSPTLTENEKILFIFLQEVLFILMLLGAPMDTFFKRPPLPLKISCNTSVWTALIRLSRRERSLIT